MRSEDCLARLLLSGVVQQHNVSGARGDLNTLVKQPARMQEHLALREPVRLALSGEVRPAPDVRTGWTKHYVEREVACIVVQLDPPAGPGRIVLGDMRRVLALSSHVTWAYRKNPFDKQEETPHTHVFWT